MQVSGTFPELSDNTKKRIPRPKPLPSPVAHVPMPKIPAAPAAPSRVPMPAPLPSPVAHQRSPMQGTSNHVNRKPVPAGSHVRSAIARRRQRY